MLWQEISDRAVVIYGVALRDALRLMMQGLGCDAEPDVHVSIAADRVLSPLPIDVQVAIMVGWMKAAVLVNEAVHRRGS